LSYPFHQIAKTLTICADMSLGHMTAQASGVVMVKAKRRIVNNKPSVRRRAGAGLPGTMALTGPAGGGSLRARLELKVWN
jgi:hypothetical protein